MKLWSVVVYVELLGAERLLGTWGPYERRERADQQVRDWREKYADAHARYEVTPQYTPDVPITAAGGPEVPR